jgi:hypothetical protein
MGLKPGDLRDDNSGFHAEVFKSDADGSNILAYEGTNPQSLNDWQTNIDNGNGLATQQYSEAGEVASKMSQSGTSFDIAGHSLGGGEAQYGGLMAPGTDVYTFNAAGLPDASLARAGASSWDDLNSRTQAFQSQDDFLSGIQGDRDPQHQLQNARNLRDELQGLYTPSYMKVTGYNGEDNKTPQFQQDLGAFNDKIDNMVNTAQAKVDAGQDPGLFPAAHGQVEQVPGLTGKSSFVSHFSSRLASENQHLMDSVINRMEATKQDDQKKLQKYVGK